MSGHFWLAVGAYLVPTFPLGYFWHLAVFKKSYEQLEIYREPVVIPLGLASMGIQALLYAWVYPLLFSTARDAWVTGALQFGAVFGLLAFSFAVLPVAAKYRMTSVTKFVKMETAFTFLQFAIVSPLIALAWRS